MKRFMQYFPGARVSTVRSIKAVPPAVLVALLLGLGAQLLLAVQRPSPIAEAEALPPAPSAAVLQLASLGEPLTLAALLMLWLQAFDNQPGISIPFRVLDYGRLIAWLEAILNLAPRFGYPLLSASRLYAEVPDDAKRRRMLAFVHAQFFHDPDHRWPWLAHAVYIAKHKLKDPALALSLARALRLHVTTEEAPAWVRQMEIFVHEDNGDGEAARIIIGGLLDSGRIAPGSSEERFLLEKLRTLGQDSGTQASGI